MLEELEVLFEDLDIENLEPEQLAEMYRIYIDEICTMVFRGKPILVNHNASRHPLCRGKHLTFEHVITRESKHSGKRNFDRDRANRIHWIRPIIEAEGNPFIKYFEAYNEKGQLQFFFYYMDRDFIVIIRELPNGNMLITSYYVDDFRKINYKKQYEEYRQKKAPLRK